MNLAAWAALVALQNAAFTWTSRARNSGSLAYHGVASTVSQSVWFVCNVFMVDQIARGADARRLAVVGVVYVVASVAGGMAAHHVLQRHVERGARRVGAAA